jgi:hypothetical protein
MQVRGRLQEGMFADITIFNPQTVKKNSTYAQGTLPTTGIPYVIVNGNIVLKDSKVQEGVFPGQPIRFPVENKKRFQPLSVENWRNEFLDSDINFGELERNDYFH